MSDRGDRREPEFGPFTLPGFPHTPSLPVEKESQVRHEMGGLMPLWQIAVGAWKIWVQ